MDQDLATIETQEDFVAFIRALAEWRWKGTPQEASLKRYLAILATYVENLNLEEFYSRIGKPAPEHPDWELFGQLLYAAGMYYEL